MCIGILRHLLCIGIPRHLVCIGIPRHLVCIGIPRHLLCASFRSCHAPLQFRTAFRHFGIDPTLMSKTTKLTSPQRRRVEIASPSGTSNRTRMLKKQPSTLNVLPSLEAMNKQRTLSFDGKIRA